VVVKAEFLIKWFKAGGFQVQVMSKKRVEGEQGEGSYIETVLPVYNNKKMAGVQIAAPLNFGGTTVRCSGWLFIQSMK